MHVVFALLAALIVASLPVAAQAPPDAKTLVMQMKEAFEPTRPSTRKVIISVSDMGQTLQFVGRSARKKLADGKRQVIVMMEPLDVRGTAILMSEPKDPTTPSVLWIYSPVIRRVRKLVPIDAYDHFLDTDFTYADLGYVRLHDRYKMLGAAEVKGVKAYKIEEKIPQEDWYYSRVVTYIAAGNKLPLQRDYYDPGGSLWKTEVFDSITDIDGSPTVLHALMKDVQAQTSTDLAVSEVRYDVDVPDSIFDPMKLGQLADHPLWQPAAAPAAK
jgi:outer membrane lipoprotein-sorting protein